MSATAEHTYTAEERAAFDEGREAYRAKVDYFDCVYMRQQPRNLYLLAAWSEGRLSAESEETP